MNAHQRVTRAYPVPLCFTDRQSPPVDRAESVEMACTAFADDFAANKMSAVQFYTAADEFAAEELGNFIPKDDQYVLLQLVLDAHEKGQHLKLTQPIIDHLRAAAYQHKEGQL